MEDDDVGRAAVRAKERVAAREGAVPRGRGDEAAVRVGRGVCAHGAREGREARVRLERDDVCAVRERDARERADARADLEHDGRAPRAARDGVQRAQQCRAVRGRARPPREHGRELREVARAQPQRRARHRRRARAVRERHEDRALAHARVQPHARTPLARTRSVPNPLHKTHLVLLFLLLFVLFALLVLGLFLLVAFVLISRSSCRIVVIFRRVCWHCPDSDGAEESALEHLEVVVGALDARCECARTLLSSITFARSTKVDVAQVKGRGHGRVECGHGCGELLREREDHARGAVHGLEDAAVGAAQGPNAARAQREGARDDGAGSGREACERTDGAAAPRSYAREVRDGDAVRTRHGARVEGGLRGRCGVGSDAERDARREGRGRAREGGRRARVLGGARDEAVDGGRGAARSDEEREERGCACAEDDGVLRGCGARGGGARGRGECARRREVRGPRVVARHALEQAQHVQPLPAPLLGALGCHPLGVGCLVFCGFQGRGVGWLVATGSFSHSGRKEFDWSKKKRYVSPECPHVDVWRV